MHKLEIEELRPGEPLGSGPVVYFYCRCGEWWMAWNTLHRRPILEAFFGHLEAEVEAETKDHYPPL